MSRCFVLFVLTVGLVHAAVDDAEVRSLIENRIGTAKKAVGIVAGILDENGQRIVAAGRKSLSNAAVPDGDTVFEIGSITKAFTGILLADMVLRGEVQLDDPVAKYLPESVNVPAFEGRTITLRDLTTQTSALPRIPSNLKPADGENPYADYTVQQMYDFVSGYKLTRAPGSKYDYSNLGVGLLGHVLAKKAGKSYEELVIETILKPLGMSRSSITLSAAHKANFAAGHTPGLAETKNWDLPTFAGAGALRSTANDMLRFLAANLGIGETPLRKAIEMSHAIQKPTGNAELSVAMGWHVYTRHNTPLIWHNGGTGGYRTFAGFVPSKKTAVVMLCNTSFSVDDIGLHALVPAFESKMLPQAVERKEIQLDRQILTRYVGNYQLAPTFVIAITEDQGKLFLQATNQPKFPIYAESEERFFLKDVEAALTFEKAPTGEVTGLTLHQNGANMKARRN